MFFFRPSVSKLEVKGDTRGLARALLHKDPSLRQQAADALDRLGWQPDQGEEGAACWATRGEWSKSAAIGAEAAAPLVRAFLSAKDPSAQKEIIDTLATVPSDKAAKALKKAWHKAKGDLRLHIMSKLGDLGLPGVKALMSMVSSCSLAAEAQHLVLVLAQNKDEDCIELLVRAYNGGESPDRYYREVLVKVGEAAAPVLVRAVGSYRTRDRQTPLTRVLIEIGAGAVPHIIAGLRRKEIHTYQLLAETLISIDPEAAGVLIEDLRTMLADLSGPDATFPLDFRVHAVRALPNAAADRALPELMACLDRAAILGSTSDVMTIADVLGHSREDRAIASLVLAMLAPQVHISGRVRAARAIQRIELRARLSLPTIQLLALHKQTIRSLANDKHW